MVTDCNKMAVSLEFIRKSCMFGVGDVGMINLMRYSPRVWAIGIPLAVACMLTTILVGTAILATILKDVRDFVSPRQAKISSIDVIRAASISGPSFVDREN